MFFFLKFNCNFDAVTGGCQSYIYLLHHLDWKFFEVGSLKKKQTNPLVI